MTAPADRCALGGHSTRDGHLADVVDPLRRDRCTMDLEQHRPELTRYCTRMLRSRFDADDAIQETMIRAWRSLDRFEHRSHVRTWLYRIATNVCVDMMRKRQRVAVPVDVSAGPPLPSERNDDPAGIAEANEGLRLAMLNAVQCLPPRQRAVFVLADVLRWSAQETADVLGTTLIAVNSLRQRARASRAATVRRPDVATGSARSLSGTACDLLGAYADAMVRQDVRELVAVATADADAAA